MPTSGSMEHGARSMESGVGADTENCRLKTENSLEQRSNGFVFDPKSSDALSEALRRIAVAGERLEVKGNDLEEIGQRSREIVAKFSCENFARQALRAAEAASARSARWRVADGKTLATDWRGWTQISLEPCDLGSRQLVRKRKCGRSSRSQSAARHRRTRVIGLSVFRGCLLC